MTGVTKYKLVYRSYWDDRLAECHKWWELYEYRKGLFGWAWRPVKVEMYAFDGMIYKDKVTGDHKWAERIAEHYGIEVPDKA